MSNFPLQNHEASDSQNLINKYTEQIDLLCSQLNHRFSIYETRVNRNNSTLFSNEELAKIWSKLESNPDSIIGMVEVTFGESMSTTFRLDRDELDRELVYYGFIDSLMPDWEKASFFENPTQNQINLEKNIKKFLIVYFLIHLGKTYTERYTEFGDFYIHINTNPKLIRFMCYTLKRVLPEAQDDPNLNPNDNEICFSVTALQSKLSELYSISRNYLAQALEQASTESSGLVIDMIEAFLRNQEIENEE